MSAGPPAGCQPEEPVNLSVPTDPDVSTQAIRTQLDKILTSPGFVHSDRMVRFLSFTVNEVLKGNASELKETVLGMEVFDRPSSFDPRTDTIVRVEARRLRAKLKEYYENSGQHDAVLIEFPKGSYVPIFLKGSSPGAVELPILSQAGLNDEGQLSRQSASTKLGRRPNFRIVLTIAALLCVGGAILWWRLHSAPVPGDWKLKPLTADSGLTTTPALSPDGKLVAYASDRASSGTNLDLWVQTLTGGAQPIRLTQNPADEMNPSFSPDGGQIAFYSSRDGGGIYVIPALGGPERLLVRGGRLPRFSPDGRWIAYYSSGTKDFLSDSQVFIIPANGGTPKRIAVDIPWASVPVWSPDGRYLLVLGATATNSPVSLMDFWLASPERGASVKTGLVPLLRARQISLYELGLSFFPVDWVGDALFFGTGSSSSIWTIKLVNGLLQPDELRKIASGTTVILDVRGSPSKLVFESRVAAFHLWNLPLDLNSGKVQGILQPLPHDGGNQTMPTSSSDGSQLVYQQSGPGLEELRLRDMISGTEKVLRTGRVRPKMSPDGTKVAFVNLPSAGHLFLMDSSGGEATELLHPEGETQNHIRHAYGWSADSKRIVYWDGTPIRFSLFDLDTKEISELISHPVYDIHGAVLSPDSNWVAFHLPRPNSEPVKIAPVRAGKAAPETEWITVTEAAGPNGRPWWSPDGNLLYFGSRRDGYSCIWAQRLDPVTRRPSGEPAAVCHLHGTRLSLNDQAGRIVGPAVGGGRIVFALSEQTGNIWLAEPGE